MAEEDFLYYLDKFFSQYKPVAYRRRDVLLQAEEQSVWTFYVKSGYARIYRVSEDGEELTLIIVKPKDFFPLSWGPGKISNHYYVEAITPMEVYRVPEDEFLQYLEIHNDVAWALTTHLLVKFSGLLTRMEYLVFGNAYTNVAATLLACAKRFGVSKGENIIVSLPLTHRDIATMVGITRETTCLEMKKLEKKGLISHKGRFFTVKDIKKLEEESLLSSDQDTILPNSL